MRTAKVRLDSEQERKKDEAKKREEKADEEKTASKFERVKKNLKRLLISAVKS